MNKIIKPLDDGKRKILSLDEAMRQIDAHQPPKPQTPQEDGKPTGTQPETGPFFYLNLEWGPGVTFKVGGELCFFYDTSLDRLKDSGYQRHPRPWEFFGILIDFLEKKLVSDVKAVARDIFNSSGEWLDFVVTREGDSLICYSGLENIRWNNDESKYVADGDTLVFADKRIFDITGIPSVEFVNLSEIYKKNPFFVNYLIKRDLYSPCFDHYLPKTVQKHATIYLPPADRTLHPVISGHKGDKFSLDCHSALGGSRGVREIK